MDKEYFLEVGEGTIAYVYFKTTKGDVYDSGHDCPHKDILNVDGEVIRKVWYDFLSNGQAVTMAITDIKDNYEVYKERYKKWLKGQ